jgi:tyrosine-protein phosphatase SIW14
MRMVFLHGFVLLSGAGCTTAPRGVPPTDRIPNFGEVDARLYRSAQPTPAALDSLAKRGVRTIINLRMPDDVDPAEEAFAQAHGIEYHAEPLSNWLTPTQAQVARILDLIERSPAPVLIHCKAGADRTGTVVACYRMQRQGWTVEAALGEARRYGIGWWQWPMRDFIRRYVPPAGQGAGSARAGST